MKFPHHLQKNVFVELIQTCQTLNITKKNMVLRCFYMFEIIPAIYCVGVKEGTAPYTISTHIVFSFTQEVNEKCTLVTSPFSPKGYPKNSMTCLFSKLNKLSPNQKLIGLGRGDYNDEVWVVPYKRFNHKTLATDLRSQRMYLQSQNCLWISPVQRCSVSNFVT